MRVGAAVAGVLLFLATAALRLLALVGFPNDHFLYLAPAQQILAGEWPSRDFVDPGTPLMYFASAAARLVVESPLLAEALLVSVAFGVAAVLTMYAASVVSGSLTVGVLVAVLEIAMFPRPYHYPKLLTAAMAIPAIWAYARQPSWSRAAVVSGCILVAFLFRHDLGVYVGAAALVAAALSATGWRARAWQVIQVALVTTACLCPYLVYLEATTGLQRHFAGGIAYSAEEARETVGGPPIFESGLRWSEQNVHAALYYTFHLLPVAAALLLLRGRQSAATIAPVAALAVAMNVALLRDPLQGRLADVAVPACILTAWLFRRAWLASGWRRPAAAGAWLALGGVLAVGANVIGRPAEQINRAGLMLPPARFAAHARDRFAELQAQFVPRQFPSRTIHALVPFLEYVGRCTTPEHRLFVGGNAPEVYVYARRLFAGGQPMVRAGFFDTIADQRRLVLKLREQNVPLALVLTRGDIDESVLVKAELETEFVQVGDIAVGQEYRIIVRANRRMRPTRTDPATGLPCFT